MPASTFFTRQRTIITAVVVLGLIGLSLAIWWYFRPKSRFLTIPRGARVVIVGNAFAERMQYFGHFETLLHSRFPEHELVVRNLGRSGDEVAQTTRPDGFNDHGHTLNDHKPDVIIACFGFNESFAGEAGLPRFEAELDRWVVTTKTTAYNGKSPPRLALVSPIAHEDLGRPGLTDGKEHNKALRLYTEAMRRVAEKRSVVFVDLFTPSLEMMSAGGPKLTINGIHLSDDGDRRIAAVLDERLFGPRPPAASSVDLEKLRREVNEKNLQFFRDYRAVNGAYIYGYHKASFGREHFPAEFAKLRRMVANRDRRIWAVAQGKSVPDTIDDSDTGTLPTIKTRFTDPIRLTTPQEEQASFTLPKGFEVNLFASEVEFPELKKPVAMAFDARGRLWVSTIPSYPMYLPGEPVNDKLLVFEDTRGTGKADRMTVFADGLYLPTGFALGDGGVYLGGQPNLLFLRDTRGTGRADSMERILHGFDTADSHRVLTNFRWGPGGDLYFNEGTFQHSSIETPYGPRRNFNGAVYRYEPGREKLDVYATIKFGNPWGHAWDRWGQDFVADAADGLNYFAAAFSGQTDYPRKHLPLKGFFEKEWRPTCGCEIVSSRNFPEDMQGDYLLNNLIGFQGILRYRMKEDGSGFTATPAEPLLKSSDPNFRPVDLVFGPDGALYVCDWYNPVIAHIAIPLRDPSRDRTRGRIWRITYRDRPLVPRARIEGATIAELLELLKVYEYRTREQARLELRRHDTSKVMAELEKWLARLDKSDRDHQHHLLEALWVHQHHDVVHEELLKRLLRSPEPRARAAATRVLCYWRDRVKEPLELLRVQVNDEHPRVRLEAVRALSFFHTRQARDIAVQARSHPLDYYLEYTLKETLDTLDERLQR